MRSIDIKEAWLEDEMATRLSLRAKFNCSDSYIRNALEKEGIDSADIYRRESRVLSIIQKNRRERRGVFIQTPK